MTTAQLKSKIKVKLAKANDASVLRFVLRALGDGDGTSTTDPALPARVAKAEKDIASGRVLGLADAKARARKKIRGLYSEDSKSKRRA